MDGYNMYEDMLLFLEGSVCFSYNILKSWITVSDGNFSA